MTDERAAPHTSDRRQLVQAEFDRQGAGPLGDWIQNNRQAGLSWAELSFRLRDMIGYTVSYETLRRWAAQDHPGGTTTDAESD